MKYNRSPQGYLIIRKGLWKTEKQIHTTKCKRYVMQHTVRWAGRCCGHGGCYPRVSCACYSTHTKISKFSSVVSILKNRKYVAFSYSWIELQGQISNYTSTPWKKKYKLRWWLKWTVNYFSSWIFRLWNLTQNETFEQMKCIYFHLILDMHIH